MSPLTKSGKIAMKGFQKQYGKGKGTAIFYASKNKGVPGSNMWESNSITSKSRKGNLYRRRK